MTLVEVVVVMAVVLLLAAMLLPAMTRTSHCSLRYVCVNNLKQMGLACRVWEGDNMDRYPMAVPATNGGSMDFITGPNAFRHLQVMSNELSTPRVVFCPLESDRSRSAATNFEAFCNSNISFFVGVDATETNPMMILFGDHNVTNGMRIKNGILNLTAKHPSGWTAEMHNKIGNICLADGSVQQTSAGSLRAAITSGGPTNRLLMPILGPQTL
jgi:hypothetical protein